MSDTTFYTSAFGSFDTDWSKDPTFDFLSYQGMGDVAAPSLDSFDNEIDSLATGNVQIAIYSNDDAYNRLRSDHTNTCGPGSAITVSSESTYDAVSLLSEPFCSPHHSSYSAVEPSAPLDLDLDLDLEMDLQRSMRLDDYSQQSILGAMAPVDPSAYGAMPPTPPRSPPVAHGGKPYDKHYSGRTAFSDYTPARRTSVSSPDYYSPFGYPPSLAQATISPTHISTQLPLVPSHSTVSQQRDTDPRRKYKCTTCPRAFARAYNLKTHMATHDPNRPKPYTCHHTACRRSFSRKHDLGRHLISIHRDDSVSQQAAGHKKTGLGIGLGINKGMREWCERCGKSWAGPSVPCDCHDIK